MSEDVDDAVVEGAAGDAAEAAPTAESGTPAAPGELTETGLEALLFVAERPLGRREIAAIAAVDRETVDARLGDLEVSLASRGIRLILDGERVALATAPEAGAVVARYLGADAVRLSPAALETLAIVAYRQPVTRAAIERIRGVDSDHTVRGLLHRRLVVELGRAESPGRPFLYGTGLEFLERFGLTSLEGLPPLDADVDLRLLDAVEAAMSSETAGAGTSESRGWSGVHGGAPAEAEAGAPAEPAGTPAEGTGTAAEGTGTPGEPAGRPAEPAGTAAEAAARPSEPATPTIPSEPATRTTRVS